MSRLALPVVGLLILLGTSLTAQEKGLQAEIYHGRFLSVLDLTDYEPVRTVDVARIQIPDGVPKDFFGLLIYGALKVDVAGEYHFHLSSDDGSRLYIEQTLVANNDYAHSRREATGKITLRAGWHPILVGYFEGVVDASLDLQWSGPGFARQEIPADRFIHHRKRIPWPQGSRAFSWLLKGEPGKPLQAVFAAKRTFSAGELRFKAVWADQPGKEVKGTIACLSEDGEETRAPLDSYTFPLAAGTKAFRLDFPEMPGEYLRIDLLGPDTLRLGDLRGSAPVMIVVDARDAPELLPVGRQMVTALGKSYGTMSKILDGPKFQPPRLVQLTFRPGIKNPAFADGRGITLSREWFAKHPRDVGVVVHEVAHLLQRYPVGKPTWLIEGIADYVRHQAHLNDGWRVPLRPRPEWSYAQGYGITAGFLLYIERHHTKTIVPVMNQALRANTYRPALWQEQTGKTLDELWQAYQDTAK
jgi:hypothetical protein